MGKSDSTNNKDLFQMFLIRNLELQIIICFQFIYLFFIRRYVPTVSNVTLINRNICVIMCTYRSHADKQRKRY